MPIYEFLCTQCAAGRDVLVDYRTKKSLEIRCVDCGAVMRAVEVSTFSVVSSSTTADKGKVRSKGHKTCGHTHACRCAVKMTRPNPFQAQIDASLGKAEPK